MIHAGVAAGRSIKTVTVKKLKFKRLKESYFVLGVLNAPIFYGKLLSKILKNVITRIDTYIH